MNMIVPVIIFLVGGGFGFWAATLLRSRDNGAALAAQLREAKEKLTALELEIREYTAKTARLDSEKSAMADRFAEQQAYLQQVQDQFQMKFENLANKIFDDKNKQSKTDLHEILNPLKQNLEGFKTHIAESFGKHAEKQFELRKEIESVIKVSSEMKFQTESLSKALKGDVKVQGNWGEIILERILEASGLRKGEDYITQGTGMGLKHPEHGSVQKPDVIVKLPENKHAIIDAKVSLTAYERFCAATDEQEKAVQLSQFLLSVKTHAKGLEERRYPDTQGLDTPDFVMMFMPIEGAYSLAMQMDDTLHAYAWERKVIIVCPSTLFAMLKIVASMWSLDRQNKNAEKIAERGGLLYDKIAGFVEDLTSVGEKIDAAQKSYGKAVEKLSTGRGNIIRQAEQLRELGVKNSKTISPKLVSEAEESELLSLPKDAA